jgi:hypothetical protein
LDDTRPDTRRPGDDGPLPRRGRRWRWGWVGFAALLLIVALSVAYVSWSRQSEARFDALLDGLRRAGEPVAPADLVHRPIPAGDDAAPDLLAAAAALDREAADFGAFEKLDLDQPLGNADRELIARVVRGERDVLEKVAAARGKRDADWRIRCQSPAMMTLLPHLIDLRSLAKLGRAGAIHARLEGDDGAAPERLRDVIAVGDAADAQPFMVAHLVAVRVRAAAASELARMAPDLAIRGDNGPAGAATPGQVRDAIRELLDESRGDAAFVASFRGERVVQLDTARLLADRKLDLNAVLGMAGAPRRGFVPPVPRAPVLNDARLMAEYVADLIKAAGASPDLQTFRNTEPKVPAPLRGNPKIHFFAAIMMPAYRPFVTEHYEGKADGRLAATALALRLYAADHGGRYPGKLDELVPAYLPAVPLDPLATGGAPLKYSTADPAAPSLYSVGEDGVDNGGSTAPLRSRGAVNRWNMKDAVLPMKPTPLATSGEEGQTGP